MPSRATTPIGSNLQFGRVDQGVDYTSAKPYVSPGAGAVYKVGKGFVGGTGQSVYIRLDKPIVVNGRTYREIYFAELSPLVRQGQRVKAGQAVMAAGSGEFGFASGPAPAAKLVGGLGAGTQATQAGQDFLDFVNGGATYTQTQPVTDPASTTAPAAGAAPQAAPLYAPTVGTPPGAQDPSLEFPGTAQHYLPGSGPVADSWQAVASLPDLSPDTQRLIALSGGG